MQSRQIILKQTDANGECILVHNSNLGHTRIVVLAASLWCLFWKKFRGCFDSNLNSGSDL